MSEATQILAAPLIKLRGAAERLSAKAPQKITAKQIGGYRSVFKGRGMEFEESRQYQSGDDVRNIDWRVTARTGDVHTKVFRDERERPVFFCLDLRRSMYFATRGVFKSVIAAKIAALLAWRNNRLGDRIGGLVFDEDRHQEIKPRLGPSAVLRLIKSLCKFDIDRKDQYISELDLESTASRLRRLAHPGSLVVVLSDFRGLSESDKSQFSLIARHCSLLFIRIYDPLEEELPAVGQRIMRDGDKDLLVNTSSADVRNNHKQRFIAHTENIQQFCEQQRIGFLSCSTQSDAVNWLRTHVPSHV